MPRPNFDYGAEVSQDNNLILWKPDGERVALIDGDMLPYIIGYTISDMTLLRAKTRIKSGQVEKLEDTPECVAAFDRLNALLNSWVYMAKCDAARVYMTDSAKNFRINLAFSQPYKGTRKAEKPPFFYEMRNYLLETHKAIISDEEEADDLMSTEAWTRHFSLCEEHGIEIGSPEHRAFSDVVFASKDKDIKINVGWHVDLETGELVWVDTLGWLTPTYKGKTLHKLKGAGIKFFYAQLIMGDSVDNYTGIPRKGMAFAYDLLDSCKTEKECYQAVLKAYKDKYGDSYLAKNYRGGSRKVTAYEMMLEQGRLAHMQRWKGEIWRPKSSILWGHKEELWRGN